MLFDIYKIGSPAITPYVQYILFNYSGDRYDSKLVTSFANTNICLGIIKEKALVGQPDGVKTTRYKPGIHTYISGMYLSPHTFQSDGTLDEICIDFTPLGFYRFFRFPAKTYILNEDIITEGFGAGAKCFFENIFEIPDFQQRGRLIEQFLLERMIDQDTIFLRQCLYHIHSAGGNSTLKEMAVGLRCSEKKIVRAFMYSFDLTPKDYMRIVKFRRALGNINENTANSSLTSISYESDYYDQSHFIKDFKFFTGKTPSQARTNLMDIKQNVIVSVE